MNIRNPISEIRGVFHEIEVTKEYEMSFTIEPNTLYTTSELSQMLGYKESTLATQRSRRIGIPFKKIDSKVFYLGPDIQQSIVDGLARNGPNDKRNFRLRNRK